MLKKVILRSSLGVFVRSLHWRSSSDHEDDPLLSWLVWRVFLLLGFNRRRGHAEKKVQTRWAAVGRKRENQLHRNNTALIGKKEATNIRPGAIKPYELTIAFLVSRVKCSSETFGPISWPTFMGILTSIPACDIDSGYPTLKPLVVHWLDKTSRINERSNWLLHWKASKSPRKCTKKKPRHFLTNTGTSQLGRLFILAKKKAFS